ncbi:MAG: FAD-dependent oxidoreductase [archaeon]
MVKVRIVGVGPAGLFAAKELAGKVDVVAYDTGREADKRFCPKTRSKTGACIHCQPCQVTHGIGGAGLMTDGKLMYDVRVGNNLNEIIKQDENTQLIKAVENGFAEYGVETVIGNEEKIEQLRRRALQNRVDFIYPRQTHIGSDNLPKLIQQFKKDLEDKGVEFKTSTEVNSLEEICEPGDIVLLAPGRVGGGEDWLENILRNKGVQIGYRPVDIGTRVETDSIVTKEVTDITRDMKFYMTTDRYQTRVRTFCTCPNGFVAQETYGSFATVNGHAESLKDGNQSPNTNFALLVTVPLTQPQSNSNENARKLGEYISNLGGGKIIAQRWGDFKRNRRSKEGKQGEYFLQPTLRDFTWGSLYFLPEIYHSGIMEGMERLDKIMPGLANDSTTLYIPEIKFHGLRIPTDNYLKVQSQNPQSIYVAGDGSGFSRGIVGAAASGILAAKGIIRELN